MTNEVGLKCFSSLFSKRIRATLLERQTTIRVNQEHVLQRIEAATSTKLGVTSPSQVGDESKKQSQRKSRWKRKSSISSSTSSRNLRTSSIARVITFPSRPPTGLQEDVENQDKKRPGDSIEFVNQVMAQISYENMIKWSFDFASEEAKVQKQTLDQTSSTVCSTTSCRQAREESSPSSRESIPQGIQDPSSSVIIYPSYHPCISNHVHNHPSHSYRLKHVSSAVNENREETQQDHRPLHQEHQETSLLVCESCSKQAVLEMN